VSRDPYDEPRDQEDVEKVLAADRHRWVEVEKPIRSDGPTQEFVPERRVGRIRPRPWVYVAIVAGVLLIAAGSFRLGRATADEVTPEICLKALDLTDVGFGYAADSTRASRDALEAVSNFDVAGIEAATREIEAVTEKVEALAPKLVPAVEGCRELAG
jgi:hypothetical protein